MIVVKFLEQGVIDLCCDQVIDHVDGGSEEHLDVGVTGGIGKCFGEEGFAGAGVTDDDDIGMPVDKTEMGVKSAVDCFAPWGTGSHLDGLLPKRVLQPEFQAN